MGGDDNTLRLTRLKKSFMCILPRVTPCLSGQPKYGKNSLACDVSMYSVTGRNTACMPHDIKGECDTLYSSPVNLFGKKPEKHTHWANGSTITNTPSYTMWTCDSGNYWPLSPLAIVLPAG
jgi:hypothetical protein